jgi:hypothetical protein
MDRREKPKHSQTTTTQNKKKRRAEEKEKRDNNTKALFPRDETTVGLIEVPGALAQKTGSGFLVQSKQLNGIKGEVKSNVKPLLRRGI